VVAQAARNVFHSVGINFNRWRGREFVPRSDKSLRIETSSTCNLKCRFCAYEKKTSPKIVMKDEFFRDCVRQGLDMGFQGFDLTPCTGDVFMDRRVFDKLEFLENEPRVAGFFFFTNFTIPDAEDIKRLVSLKKFFGMNISVYGHDLPTFKAITKSTGKVYDRLVANLNVLFTQMDRRAFGLEFSVKSIRSAPRAPVSEVLKALDRFRRAGIRVRTSTGLYNNWGGAVTKDDLRGLDMDIKGEELVYKKGACERLFNTVQIMATSMDALVVMPKRRCVSATFTSSRCETFFRQRTQPTWNSSTSSSAANSSRCAKAATSIRASIGPARAATPNIFAPSRNSRLAWTP
jgi:hypothetical protein